MFEKILQKLKDNKGNNLGVSDRTLEDLARTLEPVITTDEQLNAYSADKAINTIAGNINFEAAEAVKRQQDKVKADAEAERKRKEAEEAAKNKGGSPKPGEEVPTWAQNLIDQNEAMTKRLDGMQVEKAMATRKQQLEASLKDTPDYYRNSLIEGFDRLNFENDDQFGEYLKGVETNRDSFIQQAKEQGLNTSKPRRDVEVPEETGETSELSEARKLVREDDK